MIRVSALERLLVTERGRRRTTTHGHFAVPALQERAVDADVAPLVATNMRQSFLLTRRSMDGQARFGFSECPLDEEGTLVRELHRVLWRLSEEHQWANRCSSIADAMARMEAMMLEPHNLVVPVSLLGEVCGKPVSVEEAEQLMSAQGFVAEAGGVRVLAADLPLGWALLGAAPSLVGVYARIDDRLGILIQRADRSLVLVRGPETVAHAVA